jgi:tRNA nucleotidyltransferase (CCA-adding enzyme)
MNSLLRALQEQFTADSHDRIFLVGGSVRDDLLGRTGEDIDLAAALPAERLRRCGFRLVTGKTTAPIWFRCDPVFGKIEVTQLTQVAALDDDLRRRDFTINAMAMRLSGELLDPLHGGDDLRGGRLRACSDETFRADPLRIFRALRFEAEGWRMTAVTEELIRRDDWTARLGTIPAERFSRELLKALAAREPERFLLRMKEFRVGQGWLPEMFRMAEVPAGPLQYHPEGDLLTHAAEVLQRAAALSPDPLARFCAFFHDLGKLATDPALYPKHHGHEEAGFAMAGDFCNRLALPASYRRALAWTSRLHGHLNRWNELRDATKIKTAEQATKAGIAAILPIVALADQPGNKTPDDWELALAVAAMTTAELGIDADRLAAMPTANRAAFIMQKRVERLRIILQ